MAWTVRPLTPADQPEWRRMRLEALRMFPTAFLTTYEEQKTRPASEDRAMLAQGAWRAVFAGDQMVGIAALIPYRKAAVQHRAEIGAVYLTQTQWGTGAAGYLMQALEDEARANKKLQLELSVAANNPRAIRFYERCGFKRSGTQPRAIMLNGVGYDDYFYVKMLDGSGPPGR